MLFLFVLLFFLRFPQRHCLLEGIAHFVQALLFDVMYTLGAFSIEVDQFVVLAHGNIHR